MEDSTRLLDGNAAAGLLAEVFAFDVTSATVVCDGCGAAGPAAALTVYALEMGAILRCPGCDAPVIRVSRLSAGTWIDLRGARVVRTKFNL